MQKQVEFFTNTHEMTPEGYIENNHCLPNFTIPIPGSNGLSNPAKWIKLMEDGQVAGYSEVQGPSDPPTITDMYLHPSYHSTDPCEPMPCWFRCMLTGDPAQYYTLREALESWTTGPTSLKSPTTESLKMILSRHKHKLTPSGQTSKAGLKPRSSVKGALQEPAPMALLPIWKDSKHATSG